jgi:hypothetical protein
MRRQARTKTRIRTITDRGFCDQVAGSLIQVTVAVETVNDNEITQSRIEKSVCVKRPSEHPSPLMDVILPIYRSDTRRALSWRPTLVRRCGKFKTLSFVTHTQIPLPKQQHVFKIYHTGTPPRTQSHQ